MLVLSLKFDSQKLQTLGLCLIFSAKFWTIKLWLLTLATTRIEYFTWFYMFYHFIISNSKLLLVSFLKLLGDEGFYIWAGVISFENVTLYNLLGFQNVRSFTCLKSQVLSTPNIGLCFSFLIYLFSRWGLRLSRS